MIKKKKDFFESVLSDVSPLKRKGHIDLKKEEIKSTLKKKYYETEILAKTAISEEKEFIKTDQTKKIINDKSNFFKKLKRGKIRVDRKIDLHGLTLAQAEERFDTEIESSFNKKWVFPKLMPNSSAVLVMFHLFRSTLFLIASCSSSLRFIILPGNGSDISDSTAGPSDRTVPVVISAGSSISCFSLSTSSMSFARRYLLLQIRSARSRVFSSSRTLPGQV